MTREDMRIYDHNFRLEDMEDLISGDVIVSDSYCPFLKDYFIVGSVDKKRDLIYGQAVTVFTDSSVVSAKDIADKCNL